MFEKYMIVPEHAQNTLEEKKTTGFQFGARLPYYRGVSLSMVEDIQVKIDGKPVKPETVLFTVQNKTYSLKQMEVETEERWEMGEVAIVSVLKKGGLPKGEHTIHLMINIRIGYLPFPAIRFAEKIISI